MTWIKLDDHFFEHPKIIGLSARAQMVLLRSMCYANRNLTDGRIPAAFAKSIAPPRVIGELVDAECWHQNGTGWVIHDYADYQRTRADIEATRAADRERLRRWRGTHVTALQTPE